MPINCLFNACVMHMMPLGQLRAVRSKFICVIFIVAIIVIIIIIIIIIINIIIIIIIINIIINRR